MSPTWDKAKQLKAKADGILNGILKNAIKKKPQAYQKHGAYIWR
jgi:hypothetical protein